MLDRKQAQPIFFSILLNKLPTRFSTLSAVLAFLLSVVLDRLAFL